MSRLRRKIQHDLMDAGSATGTVPRPTVVHTNGSDEPRSSTLSRSTASENDGWRRSHSTAPCNISSSCGPMDALRDQDDLACHASLSEQLVGLSCLDKRESLRDQRLDLVLLEEIEQS